MIAKHAYRQKFTHRPSSISYRSNQVYRSSATFRRPVPDTRAIGSKLGVFTLCDDKIGFYEEKRRDQFLY